MPDGIVRQYRESHHRIAQMFAMGCTASMIRRQTGVSTRRLGLLYGDPSFQDLIAQYSEKAKEKLEVAQDAFADLAISNMLRAESQLADHLDESEETGELLRIGDLLKIAADRADRFGYGKNSTVKVEHDFSTRLDKAIARSEAAKVIEGSIVEPMQIEAQPPAPPSIPAGPQSVVPASSPIPQRLGPRTLSEALTRNRKIA